MTQFKAASLAIASAAILIPAGQAIADTNVHQLKSAQSDNHAMAQVNSVFQLRDVAPSDWAFDALRNLVEKYIVILDTGETLCRTIISYDFV